MLPEGIDPRVAASCLRGFLKGKSDTELENVIQSRLRPDARALLKMLIAVKVTKVTQVAIRDIGRASDGTAFVKRETGPLQRVNGDADAVLRRFVSRAPGISAFYATTVPHLIQIMRRNSELLRGPKEGSAIEAAPASPKRVRKKQRHK